MQPFRDEFSAMRDRAREILSPSHDDLLDAAQPAIHLCVRRPGETLVGRIGGAPELPSLMEWPLSSQGHPVPFLMQIDLGAIAGARLPHGLELPVHGHLLAFAVDSVLAGGPVNWTHDSVQRDARLIYIPGSRKTTLHPTPKGGTEYPSAELSAASVLTLPEAVEGLEDDGRPRHQLGGWTDPRQDDVVADYLSRRKLTEPAENWKLLLQVDDDRRFGDMGAIYWLTDTTTGDALERTGFVVQHG